MEMNSLIIVEGEKYPDCSVFCKENWHLSHQMKEVSIAASCLGSWLHWLRVWIWFLKPL